MPSSVIDREYLEIRATILQLAAALDRLERCNASKADDPRIGKIREGIQLIQSETRDRAAAVQLHFSRPYDAEWKSKMSLG